MASPYIPTGKWSGAVGSLQCPPTNAFNFSVQFLSCGLQIQNLVTSNKNTEQVIVSSRDSVKIKQQMLITYRVNTCCHWLQHDNRQLSKSSTNVGKQTTYLYAVTYRTSSYNTDEMPYNMIRSWDRFRMENTFTIMNNSFKVGQVKFAIYT